MRDPRTWTAAEIERFNNLSSEEVARALEKLPTDVLEWAVRFEALAFLNVLKEPALAVRRSTDAAE